MKDLSIVIISYNTKDLTGECVESIKKNVSAKISYEIIVVDNDSKDGSVDFLKNKFPDVLVIASKENLGFSKANNVGIKKSVGRYVLCLNSDTVVYPGVLEYMINFMDKNKEVGASTCELETPNGEIDDASHRGFPTPWNALTHFSGLSKIFPHSKLFSGYWQGWKDLTKIHEIDVLAGAFMLIRREAGEEAGWWDEDYFFYGEDVDFCYQLKQKGWKIYYVPTVKILHYKGASGGIKKVSQNITTATKETKKRVTKSRFNAMRIFYRKNYVNKYPKALTWLVMQGINFREKMTSI
ncbi:glycosyltransferase family 2 protein [Patescibacteria group bacterium]|nr:glycosyltransferase family 2 protein [Patescibacteria group bacterium]